MDTVTIITEDIISSKILIIRNQKVMLDRDLASLYNVETKYLKKTGEKKHFPFSKRLYASIKPRRAKKLEEPNWHLQFG